MPSRHTDRRKPAAAALTLLLISLALLACGGSSGSSATTTTPATATATTGTSSAPGKLPARVATIRACLIESGIAPTKPTPGKPPALGGLVGVGSQLPKGMTHAQYEAALRKCGLARAGTGTAAERLRSPAYRKTLTRFTACMREHGQHIPNPSTSGTGPIFNTTGLNTLSPQFKAATVKCAGILRGSFGGPPGE
jgi:hypothetical protein